MDGVSIAASIIGIATAGVQVSIKLVTLATQISTASDRVSAIGNDISLTAGVLRQLGDLMAQETKDGSVSILNPEGLETTRTAAAMCERIFSEIEKEVKRASEQLRRYKPGLGKMRGPKIDLSKTEKAKWPFLQPTIDGLRADLRDAKSTLILLLQVATLALNKRMADASMPASEDQDLIRAVVALLERREERTDITAQQEASRSPSPGNAPDIGITNNVALGKTVLNTKAVRTRGPGPADILEDPPKTFPGKNSAEDIIMNPPHWSVSPGTFNDSELQLFLLKPQVKDLHDRIELRWTVQDTNMQPLAIRKYMDENEKNEIPSVVEMLEQLHAYEQEMVESETPKDSGRSILSLKRTTIDIPSRTMLFKAVPGLQFVVQRQLSQSQLQNRFDMGLDHPPAGKSPGGGHARRGPYDTTGVVKPKPPPKGTRQERKSDLRIPVPWGQPAGLHAPDDLDVVQGEGSLDEKADADAEAMVNDLLKQYTTLFNP